MAIVRIAHKRKESVFFLSVISKGNLGLITAGAGEGTDLPWVGCVDFSGANPSGKNKQSQANSA